jgi:hypothetical protein
VRKTSDNILVAAGNNNEKQLQKKEKMLWLQLYTCTQVLFSERGKTLNKVNTCDYLTIRCADRVL